MTRIPPEIIRASIKTGSVYYFYEETFQTVDPHFFVVLNRDPLSDEVIILACSSSQNEKTLKRRSNFSPETFVIGHVTDQHLFPSLGTPHKVKVH